MFRYLLTLGLVILAVTISLSDETRAQNEDTPAIQSEDGPSPAYWQMLSVIKAEEAQKYEAAKKRATQAEPNSTSKLPPIPYAQTITTLKAICGQDGVACKKGETLDIKEDTQLANIGSPVERNGKRYCNLEIVRGPWSGQGIFIDEALIKYCGQVRQFDEAPNQAKNEPLLNKALEQGIKAVAWSGRHWFIVFLAITLWWSVRKIAPHANFKGVHMRQKSGPWNFKKRVIGYSEIFRGFAGHFLLCVLLIFFMVWFGALEPSVWHEARYGTYRPPEWTMLAGLDFVQPWMWSIIWFTGIVGAIGAILQHTLRGTKAIISGHQILSEVTGAGFAWTEAGKKPKGNSDKDSNDNRRDFIYK